MNTILFIIIVAILIFIKIEFNKALKQKKQHKKNFKKRQSKQKKEYKPKSKYSKSGYDSLYKTQKKKTTYAERQKKGEEYEKYIADFFKEQNYTISNHGIDNKKKDGGIDVIAKKDKTILFIQCKNWNAKNKNRITHVDIKKTRTEINDYIEKNPLYKNYKIKTYYITSEDILDKSAKLYIKEHKEKIEHLIIPMKTNY